jgi:hypothetical protein
MPDLFHSLQGRDLGYLKIVAELWGLELSAPDGKTGLIRLAPLLLEPTRVQAMLARLPANARLALNDVLENGGRMAWALFTRRHGSVREMGAGRRDRERPYLSDPTPAEALIYRAVIGRAFFDGERGPEECAYVPDDLLGRLPLPEHPVAYAPGRPATPGEKEHLIPADDRILDQACTLLAAARAELPDAVLECHWLPDAGRPNLTPAYLRLLLQAAGLLDAAGKPLPDATRDFLELKRSEALNRLGRGWLAGAGFDELRWLPGLRAEGEWTHDPLAARQAVMSCLSQIPGYPGGGSFWSLGAFLMALKTTRPDFLRLAGDYDSWFLRDLASGEYLRGFEHWDEVDGALIRFIICGPLRWLGMMELAAPSREAPAAAFRFTRRLATLIDGSAAEDSLETAVLTAASDGRLHVSRLAPRSIRYQLARFGEWEGIKGDVYVYRLTPESLGRARKAGLRVSHLLGLLRRAAPTVPPPLSRALERWEERGAEARLEQAVVLRVGSPEVLQALRSTKAARHLGDALGPTAVIVRAGAWRRVMAALAELGYLVDSAEINDP